MSRLTSSNSPIIVSEAAHLFLANTPLLRQYRATSRWLCGRPLESRVLKAEQALDGSSGLPPATWGAYVARLTSAINIIANLVESWDTATPRERRNLARIVASLERRREIALNALDAHSR